MPLASFHPTIQRWFADRLGEPTEPQRAGWPHIRAGRNTLIAAPTGTGKTLAGFLSAIDALARAGAELPDETRVLYVSPLRALSNDVQKNLTKPLRELAQLDDAFPEIRVQVRTGDTSPRDRAAMLRTPPHILVTTPESLYILLTSAGGRRLLAPVKTVLIDEIHALTRDKRGSHLALSLERLEALAGPLQRIGLSATQKPVSDVARFLVGAGRDCELVDVGHRRPMDVAIEVPPSPLTSVCSHEQWDEIYARVAALITEHRTTLVFVNTRKMAERISARLAALLGETQAACHHSSLSRDRRLDAEQRLKAGTLRALVATASLELGIDIGDIDLVIQVGATRSIATLLQRIGRAGHAVRRVPKGRLFPVTIDELVEGAALLRAALRGELDRTPQPAAPLDILAQQIVAACVERGDEGWSEDVLFDTFTRAWPYRNLGRSDFDAVIAMHTGGRRGLLHRDGIGRRVMARKRSRITAITGGGAIPDVADYRVVKDPDGTFIGTLNEDFAIESNVGDVFQLGNASWRVLRVSQGVVRVADAKGQPPSVPFWLGEGPSRTVELSAAIGQLREDAIDPLVLQREINLSPEAAMQIAEYLAEGVRVLGAVPTQRRIILERFFDESGGMQLVLHAPFGGRINRAWGLALRKRFCRGFGFELQAAANEEAIVISLGTQHSFPLESVFNYLHPNTVRKTLTQAVLDQPMFESRWRWNAIRSLVLERFQNGKPVAPPLLRMRAGDLLARSFPSAIACPENLPPGDLEIPMDHPLVWQTIEDCLTEATDVDGLTDVLTSLGDGRIERIAVDTVEPSAFARGILSAQPYGFLDDAPLEERRTQAVLARRTLKISELDTVGMLDPAAVIRVREEAWPTPESVEEVHDALLWMGYITDDEARGWLPWLTDLAAAHRVIHADGRWSAADGPREPKRILLGRLEALGPVADSGFKRDDQPMLLELERDGAILRTRLNAKMHWCERRLLARIHRYTLDALRREIEPVTPTQFLQFLAHWQHVEEDSRLDGPAGVAEILRQLAGFEIPASAWEATILPRRVRDYHREWLDELTMAGEFAWGRLWGSGGSAIRVTPITFIPRDELQAWLEVAPAVESESLAAPASEVFDALASRGAVFPQDLARAANLLPAYVERGLAELIARGVATCDSFAALRQLITPPSRRRRPVKAVGRWSVFRDEQIPGSTMAASAAAAPRGVSAVSGPVSSPAPDSSPFPEIAARHLLARTGVVFRKTLERERLPVSWSALIRIYRKMELRGEVRGGRFVAGFSGEQFALPAAVDLLRRIRREPARPAVTISAADPLNFEGILTPNDRIGVNTHRNVRVG